MHGFALNLDPDLSLFRLIVPCGVTEYGVCSVASTSARRPTAHALAPLACQSVAGRLERELTRFLDASAIEDEQLLEWLRGELAAH
jgi:lipoate-protein ligase B